MHKPRLSYPQIWNMCFGFLGIQIGFDLQNGNMSRIFQTLGADMGSLAILWIAAPLTGLIVQPIIGHFSDRTWGRLGRRRPYFLVGAVLATFALFVMPNSPSVWVAAGMLWVLDASLNITMEPTRALVGDMLPDEQRTTGYAMQSFFIGIGALFAGFLPMILTEGFGISNTAEAGKIGLSVHIAFYVGGAALLLAILWTVFTTREYSPEDMASFEAARRAQLGEAIVLTPPKRSASAYSKGGIIWLGIGLLLGALVYAARLEPRPSVLGFLPAGLEIDQEVYVLAALIAVFGMIQLVAGQITRKGEAHESGFLDIVTDLFSMPKTMQQLAVVQFFTWFGLFAMWIFGTPAIAEYHYGSTDPTSAAYQNAADWWSGLGGVRNGVAAAAALGIMWLAYRMDRRHLHALCLATGVAGFASMFVLPGQTLWLSMVGVGIGWAAIVSVPYAILAGSIPAAKMGIFMGIFNIFIVVPQLVAATLLGFLLSTFFDEKPVFAFAIAAVSWSLAAIAVLFVKDVPEDASPEPIGAQT